MLGLKTVNHRVVTVSDRDSKKSSEPSRTKAAKVQRPPQMAITPFNIMYPLVI